MDVNVALCYTLGDTHIGSVNNYLFANKKNHFIFLEVVEEGAKHKLRVLLKDLYISIKGGLQKVASTSPAAGGLQAKCEDSISREIKGKFSLKSRPDVVRQYEKWFLEKIGKTWQDRTNSSNLQKFHLQANAEIDKLVEDKWHEFEKVCGATQSILGVSDQEKASWSGIITVETKRNKSLFRDSKTNAYDHEDERVAREYFSLIKQGQVLEFAGCDQNLIESLAFLQAPTSLAYPVPVYIPKAYRA